MTRLLAACVLGLLLAAPASAGVVAGEKRINLVYFAWLEDPLPTKDVPTRTAGALNALNTTWKSASFGKVWFTGKGYGYYLVPKRTVTSWTQLTAVQNEVRALATAQGDAWVSESTSIFWITPAIGMYSQAGGNFVICVNGAKIDHEAGHWLGFGHAMGLNINGTLSTTFMTQFDVMGQGGYGNYVQQRVMAGWVDVSGSPYTVTETGSGTFALSSATLAAPTGPLGVLICGGTHFVELRQDRVFIYRRSNPMLWYLLDLNPTSVLDQVLDVGQSYVPPDCTQMVTTLSNARTSAVVEILDLAEPQDPLPPSPPVCVEGSSELVTVSGQSYRVSVDADCAPTVQGPL